jgi:diguanylate cyclase (GGDEF)-like protein
LDLVFASIGSVVLTGTITTGALAVITWRTGDWIVLCLFAMTPFVAAYRAMLARRYQALRARGGLVNPFPWERWYAIGAVLLAAIIASGGFRAFQVSTDPGVHLLAASLTIGYGGALVGRGASRPRIAFWQFSILLFTLAAAMGTYDELTYKVLAVLVVLFALALVSVVLGLYDTTVGVFVARHERELVAAELQMRNEALLASDAAVRSQAERFDAAVSNLPHGLAMFDGDQKLLMCNEQYGEMYRLPEQLLREGTTLREMVAYRSSTGTGPATGHQPVPHVYEGSCDWADGARNVELQDGRTIRERRRPMPCGGYVTTHEDVTEAIRAEARIKHMARHDPLTGLPNRADFRDELLQAVRRSGEASSVALLCLDLDRFKAVNDTLGHPAGDTLLVEVSRRLRSCLVQGDMAARLGGDEFSIIQVGVAQPSGSDMLAQRLIDVLSAPYDVDGQEVVIGVSIGIAIAPRDGSDPDQLLKKADLALYGAKGRGRGVHCFFEPGMDAAIQEKHALEVDLRLALARGEFALRYQPQVNLASGEVTGFEALLRWHHPTRGLVSPADFIGVAEEVGLIVPIGEWVLRQACAEAARWSRPWRVAVNLSPAQLTNRHVFAAVMTAFASSGLPAARLELEVTETVMLDMTPGTLTTLERLKAAGVSIALDDFGTGYVSLGYLRRFPFDKIKIDRSFIQELPGQSGSLAIVRAIASLGAALDMVITAEGVETAEQLASVREEGCTEVQGYLLSKPVPAQEVERVGETVRVGVSNFQTGAGAALRQV